MALTQLSERDQSAGHLLIEALDEDGYLSQSLEELVELLPPELEVGMDELQIALRHLQNLDPTGVGARNPGECLKLHLKALPADTPCPRRRSKRSSTICDVLAAHDFVKLKKLLHCDDAVLRGVST